MDTNIIQLAYEAFNDSCDPSRSSMAEKLPGWRATLQNLLEKHENFKGSIPAQACDHIFIYLETRSFTNKPILSDSDDGNDNEQYNIGATPPQGTAPSNLSIVGRYILPPQIFQYLETIKPGAKGEIQLTDGLLSMLQQHNLFAYEFKGTRYDGGTPMGLLRASLAFALERQDTVEEAKTILREFHDRSH